jgi:hypothetical protein
MRESHVTALLDRARDAVIPEPIIFTVDPDGTHHFATQALPWRSTIDLQLVKFAPYIKVDEQAATVTITLDSRTATYKRRGYGLHGEWICDLVSQ